jgi:curli biogenesis system outer membrane secretion channel CsgG
MRASLSLARRIALILLAALAASATPVAAREKEAPPPAAPPLPALVGPKPTLAVGVIEASGGYGDTNWDVGNGLRSMLTKALEDSGRFIVVERANLDQVINEKQMLASRVSGGGAAPSVRMIAAQYLVVGTVAEFGAPNKGGGLNIGGNLLGGVGGLGLNRVTGKVKIDLRVVNARTGEVVKSFTVEKSASKTSIGLSGDIKGVAFGGDAFMKTPMGDASRRALEDAVAHIAAALLSGPWEGKVVSLVNGAVLVNAGSDSGLQPGDRLRVERLGETFTDPDTGAILSEERFTLGELVVMALQPRMAEARFIPAYDGILPERGDFVVFQRR